MWYLEFQINVFIVLTISRWYVYMKNKQKTKHKKNHTQKTHHQTNNKIRQKITKQKQQQKFNKKKSLFHSCIRKESNYTMILFDNLLQCIDWIITGLGVGAKMC